MTPSSFRGSHSPDMSGMPSVDRTGLSRSQQDIDDALGHLGSPVLAVNPTPRHGVAGGGEHGMGVQPRRIEQFFAAGSMSPVVDGTSYSSKLRSNDGTAMTPADAGEKQQQHSQQSVARPAHAGGSEACDSSASCGWKVIQEAGAGDQFGMAADSTPAREAIVASGMAPSPVFIAGLDLTEGTMEPLPPSPPPSMGSRKRKSAGNDGGQHSLSAASASSFSQHVRLSPYLIFYSSPPPPFF